MEEHRVLGVHRCDSALLENWIPPIARSLNGDTLAEGDFPSLSNFWRIPIVSQRAWEVLRSLLGRCEALPIIHPTGNRYYIVHIMETIDALDERRSEVARNRTTGRINSIRRYSFVWDRIHGKHIFKLPADSGGEVIVDCRFREAVEQNGLRGLVFTPLPICV
ncbi:imm11 family protein [Rubinisphaera margarita]|uniref:imm11 family protein n=1 Tax=Rubinisphaera margarita TaxID=2909586 RepID=UPI0036F33E28